MRLLDRDDSVLVTAAAPVEPRRFRPDHVASVSGSNSSPPVESILNYMGRAVSTSITKNGNTITGAITKIVVVATAHGYRSDPGHAGTGTIIATYY